MSQLPPSRPTSPDLPAARASSERHFRHLLEQLPAGAYTCDANGLITYYNQRAVRLWGRAPRLNDPTDRYCGSFKLFAPDGAPIAHDACWMALALHNQREYNGHEIVVARPDGQRLTVLAHANPIFDDDHTLIGAVNVLVDISAQKAAEEERRQFEAQLQHAQKLESLGVLAGGIAHDFNNLLTAMLGYANLASLEIPPESEASTMLREIELAAQRAADLARQMLTYAGRNTFATQPLRLDTLVRDLARLLETVVTRQAVLQLDLGEVTIMGDQSQIGQVVMNLITNAAEALEGRQGAVRVRTGHCEASAALLAGSLFPEALSPGSYACIEVEDTGCGMDAATAARIFEPFFSTKFTGRGLGLAAVLGIVKSHGGTLIVSSKPDRGTRVLVLFPSLGASLPPEAPAAIPTVPRVQGRVLVIDDEVTIRTFARRVLERAGLEVYEAPDGYAGLALFAEHQPEIDLVLLDLTMPGIGGQEVLRELRYLQPDIKVLIMSGYSAQEVRARIDGPQPILLQKPFRPSELITRVEQLVPSGS